MDPKGRYVPGGQATHSLLSEEGIVPTGHSALRKFHRSAHQASLTTGGIDQGRGLWQGGESEGHSRAEAGDTTGGRTVYHWDVELLASFNVMADVGHRVQASRPGDGAKDPNGHLVQTLFNS